MRAPCEKEREVASVQNFNQLICRNVVLYKYFLKKSNLTVRKKSEKKIKHLKLWGTP